MARPSFEVFACHIMRLGRVPVNNLEIVDTLSSPTYSSTLCIACLQSQMRNSLGRPVSTSGMQGSLSRAGTLDTAKGRAEAGHVNSRGVDMSRSPRVPQDFLSHAIGLCAAFGTYPQSP